MALSHAELYEALKPSLGEKAAEMIAAVVSRDPATRADIALLRADIEALETRLEAKMDSLESRLEAKIDRSFQTMRWMLTFMIPVWAGTWGMVLTLLLKG